MEGCGCPADTSAEGRSTDRAGRRDQRHYQYLKENKPSVIGVMRMHGNIIPYLQSIDEQADEMCFQLVKQLAKQEGVTEELKRHDQMEWVSVLNNICDRVNEIILNAVIFV